MKLHAVGGYGSFWRLFMPQVAFVESDLVLAHQLMRLLPRMLV